MAPVPPSEVWDAQGVSTLFSNNFDYIHLGAMLLPSRSSWEEISPVRYVPSSFWEEGSLLSHLEIKSIQCCTKSGKLLTATRRCLSLIHGQVGKFGGGDSEESNARH